jgi:hypothetical protein
MRTSSQKGQMDREPLVPLRLQVGPRSRFDLLLEAPIDPAVLVNCEFPELLEKLVVYVDDKKGAARLAIPLRCDAFFSQILSAFAKYDLRTWHPDCWMDRAQHRRFPNCCPFQGLCRGIGHRPSGSPECSRTQLRDLEPG